MWKSGRGDFGVSQSLNFIKASATEIVAVLNQMSHTNISYHEYGQPINVSSNSLYLLYQLRDCEWTTFECIREKRDFSISPWVQTLVKELKTDGISYFCNNTTESAGYEWFNKSQVIEEFSYPNSSMNGKLVGLSEAEVEKVFLEAENAVDSFLKSKNILALHDTWSGQAINEREDLSHDYQIDFISSGYPGFTLDANDFEQIYLVEFSDSSLQANALRGMA
ncbi:hypothetical protein SPB21_26840 [Leptothoe sp. ISB3NOV94-8A]